MPLDFTNQEPFTKDHCVYIYGMDGDKAVLCQIYTETLMQMHGAEADPLEAFALCTRFLFPPIPQAQPPSLMIMESKN
jgi:hypothetical protein